RAIEEDGQDYHFVGEEQFLEAVRAGQFVEHLTIDGHRYGIKADDINRLFEKGSVYLVMNRYGADILKQTYGEQVVRIFLCADRTTVERRQREVGLSEPEIDRHLSHYDEDMEYGSQCEHS